MNWKCRNAYQEINKQYIHHIHEEILMLYIEI